LKNFFWNSYVRNGLSYLAEETRPTLCKMTQSLQLGFGSEEPNKHQLLHIIQSVWPFIRERTVVSISFSIIGIRRIGQIYNKYTLAQNLSKNSIIYLLLILMQNWSFLEIRISWFTKDFFKCFSWCTLDSTNHKQQYEYVFIKYKMLVIKRN